MLPWLIVLFSVMKAGRNSNMAHTEPFPHLKIICIPVSWQNCISASTPNIPVLLHIALTTLLQKKTSMYFT